MHSQARGNDRGGFTLVELIVVLMILAIAAGLIIPYAVGTSDMQAVAAARIVACDLQYAQNMAITAQSPVTVAFGSTGRSYSLLFSNESQLLIHPITKAGYCVDFGAMQGFGRLQVSGVSFGGGTSVTFDEFGAPDSPGAVTLQCGAHVYRVEVAAATGNVTVTRLST